jgi:SNARE associated Golgi protein/transporter associated domain-containing protein/CBS domain protein
VPETLPADDLLEQVRRERRQLALVVDEYGGTAGIVTWDDLAAALLGSLEPEAGPRRPRMETVGGTLLLDGLTRVDELEEVAGVRVAPGLRQRVETLGGLVMAHLGRQARPGDEVWLEGCGLGGGVRTGARLGAAAGSAPHRAGGAAPARAGDEQPGRPLPFVVLLVPVLPDDAICAAAGLSKMSFNRFWVLATLGRLPGTALSVFAASGFVAAPPALWLRAGAMVVAGAVPPGAHRARLRAWFLAGVAGSA